MKKGTGILYDLTKKAMLTKNYKELDDAIRYLNDQFVLQKMNPSSLFLLWRCDQ